MPDTATDTDVALFMLITTMLKKFIVTVEAHAAKVALWMSFESCFIRCFVSRFAVLHQLRIGVESMLVGENLFVSCAQVTNILRQDHQYLSGAYYNPLFVYIPEKQIMSLLYMALQLWPTAVACHITIRIRTIEL